MSESGSIGNSMPYFLIVDPESEARRITEAALLRRFGSDYRVLTVASGTAAVEALELLASRGEEVALIAAELHLPDMSGLVFLEQAHKTYKDAARALLVPMDAKGTRIPFAALDVIKQATALGRIDFYIVKGWVSPEEGLYPQIQDALTRWARARGQRHEVIRVVGEQQSLASHTLRDALTRNTVPFGFYAIDSDEGRSLAARYSVDASHLPAVVMYDGTVLHQPNLADVAQALGMHVQPLPDLYDLAIVGAGPAGMAASVYSSSEGLRTLVVEAQSIGGQAGTSSMIRNYLGFPRGVSGGELTFRAWEQTLVFGTEFLLMRYVTGLGRCEDGIALLLDGEAKARSKSVLIAAGVSYRRLDIASLERLIGLGVFYGAAAAEAPAMSGRDVYVIGGANSAGQAALHLAQFAMRVTLVVRAQSLSAGMSDYLVRQIESTPNIDILLGTEVVGGSGESFLEALELQERGSGRRNEVKADALFVLIGAEPRTDWLASALELDDHGFILTDRDVPRQAWLESRAPLPYETSMPGVFAVGDVRHGSMKRVAAAAGEGAVAIGSVHQFLASIAGN
jgi:thioredoxin reductase (NADPH)